MANLEPDIGLIQRGRWITDDPSEALETLPIFRLLFVDYPQAEVYFIRLVEIRRHAHDLRKRFLGMIQ